jgi:hypothetical protein
MSYQRVFWPIMLSVSKGGKRLSSKEVTYERAETMWRRAIEGSQRLGLEDVASEYEAMGLDGYIEKKGLRIVNPASSSNIERNTGMANLTISDYETFTDFLHDRANEVLEDGTSKPDLVKFAQEVADLTHPDSTIIFNEDGTCEAEFEEEEEAA